MALPKFSNPTVEDELEGLSVFVSNNLKDYIVSKYQKNMVRVLLEFYDYNLKVLLRDVVDAVGGGMLNPEDNEGRQLIFKCMYKGILDTFDGCIFTLIRIIGQVYDEEKGTNVSGGKRWH